MLENETEEMETEEDITQDKIYQAIDFEITTSLGTTVIKKLENIDAPIKVGVKQYITVCWKLEKYEEIINEKKSMNVIVDESANNILKKKTMSLFDCLDKFVTPETLSPQDPWYCPECKTFREADKKMDLYKLPEILVVHLKRFSYNRYWRDKIDVVVNFPIKSLDLTKYVLSESDVPQIYDLYAVSNHFGGLGGGHYTAYCKNDTTNDWYRFDDSNVSKVNDVNDVISKSAYVLFYKRRDPNKNDDNTNTPIPEEMNVDENDNNNQ
eukprot:TRINITY_DN11875_c0_g1_i1.p1 TRINITY_DN11875_c0_g1~~TRINITY_DN11875_c0_g1_i1.p1  ORF type:complete len:267 (+),score=108.39 TRINITY_DN11875_c0_g1_i1:207-1007(+)